jgi:hypothetical protein
MVIDVYLQTTEGEFTCYGKVCCSCSTSLNRRVTIVTNPVISHEWGKTKIVIVRARIMKLNATFNNDHMVVGFKTIYSIGAYHHTRCEFESCSGEVYSVQHYVIKLSVTCSRSVVPMTPIVIVRRAWKYQRGNQNLYIEEEQPIQWPKENKQKDTQWSTKHTYKTKDRVTYKLIYYLVCICSGVSLGNVVMIPEPSLQIVSITN